MEKAKKHEASAQFAKLQRAAGAKKATTEYESTAAALRAKTERLKALRLARDAAIAPPEAAVVKKSPRKRKSANSGSLSDWLDGQAKEGRRS